MPLILLSFQVEKTTSKGKRSLPRDSKKVIEKAVSPAKKPKKAKQPVLFGHYHEFMRRMTTTTEAESESESESEPELEPESEPELEPKLEPTPEVEPQRSDSESSSTSTNDSESQ